MAVPPTAPRKGFDLRIWFVAISLAAILIVNTLTAFLLSRYVAQSFINREGEVAREFLDSIVLAENSAPHLFDEPAPSPELQSFSNHVRKLPGMIRAIIYSPDYFIRFSTDEKMIGLEFADNVELRDAFEGRIIASMEEAEESTKTEHIAFNLPEGEEIIEAYIPVRDATGKVVAVVEFYSLPDALKTIISRVNLTIWATALLSGLLLFGALYGAVARGSRIIVGQQRELADMAALAALGQMASAVAHSLRNPLAGIRSSTELLKMQHGEAVEPAAADILGEVDRMNQHVHELLDYSRSDAGSAQAVELIAILRDLLLKSEPRFTRQGICIDFDERSGAGLKAVLDPPMFNQALASVLSNALEAMPDGGTLRVVLRHGAEGAVELLIGDTGRGIPADVLKQLPSPFLTTKTRGLGLGLALADRIIRSFGGSFSLSSTPGQGTTVSMSFPQA
jgi:two-component system sensor histidine kinase HydH